MSFIKFENVSYIYEDNKIPAIDNLNIEIGEGEFIAVLGHNGSGKSTFAKLINGLLLPTRGKVTVGGIDTADESKRLEVLRQVGMIFQNPDNQIVASIVEEDVAFGPENLGVPPDEIRQRVDNSLKTVDMYSYRKNAPYNLSGGQKQRVAIAGVLAMNPKCIVMDESTAMLDPQGRNEVMAAVKKLNDEKGITIIYITHFMEEATIAKRVLIEDKGRLILDGTPKEVFSEYQTIKDCGLDVPQTYEFMKRLGRSECVLNVDECVDVLEGLLK
jgi:energy-coupling factor transport system ATP-binding protein